MINNAFNRYYAKNIRKEEKSEDKIEIYLSQEKHEILMPFDLYTSKAQENIDFIMTKTYFRNKHMQKIDRNIDIISKLFYEEKRDVQYIAKWMRIPVKLFAKWIKSYFEQINDRTSKSLIKIKNKIERFKDIKGLIQIYLGLNRGKCVNAKDILKFIQPCNL